MPIDLYWDDNEQTVMLCEFKGRWSWDELHAVLHTIKKLSAQRQQVFGAIIDVREGLHIPGGSIFNREALNNFQQMLKLGSDGKGPVVILGMNSMIRTIFDTVGRVDKKATKDVHFAETMEQARQTIYGIVQRVTA